MNLYAFYGNSFTIECPTCSGRWMNLYEVSEKIANGRRPVFGDAAKFQEDPHWKDRSLFCGCFHDDTGVRLGASRQTGWAGIVAMHIQLFGYMTPEQILSPAGQRLGYRRRTGATPPPGK